MASVNEKITVGASLRTRLPNFSVFASFCMYQRLVMSSCDGVPKLSACTRVHEFKSAIEWIDPDGAVMMTALLSRGNLPGP